MNIRKVKLKWSKVSIAPDVEKIKASYDTWTEWKQDPIGYFLIKVEHDKKQIVVGFCKEGNVVEKIISGDDGEAIYNTILHEELVTSLQHAAYLGYELQKAEIALKLGLRYAQDASLEFEDDKKN